MSARDNTKWHERDSAAGLALLVATALSFALLNSPWGPAFHHAVEGPLAFGITPHMIVNDGLMAVFFLYVGLELKRETLEGPFRDARRAAAPAIAALGGMAAPALIYLAVAGRADANYAAGWAIPAATDIAFSLGALSLLGARVAPQLRLFLLSLAIIDDLGAILVIAFFYTAEITTQALGAAMVVFAIMMLMNRYKVRTLWPYWILAFFLWVFVAASGVHATIAGVLTAMAVPMRRADGRSPLIAAEHALKPIVLLAIMPIFALTNAGVSLSGVGLESVAHPVALGAGLGLLLGKPIGITGFALLAAWALKREAPAPLVQLIGVSLIAGMGFTMSLFIGALAFGDGALATPLRLGVLGGSFVAAALGLAVLRYAPAKP